MAEMGRPKADINEEQVRKLAKLQCTNQEIADFFGVCEKTIRNRFSEILKLARADGKMSLRRTQFKHAEKSASMAQFLGKQYLGQRDRQELDVKAAVSPFEKFCMDDRNTDADGQESATGKDDE